MGRSWKYHSIHAHQKMVILILGGWGIQKALGLNYKATITYTTCLNLRGARLAQW